MERLARSWDVFPWSMLTATLSKQLKIQQMPAYGLAKPSIRNEPFLPPPKTTSLPQGLWLYHCPKKPLAYGSCMHLSRHHHATVRARQKVTPLQTNSS